MKSAIGLLTAICVIAAFGIAWGLAQRPGATWLDAQWLYLAALPYNWASLRLTGESNFTPDAWTDVAAALLFEAALAYVAGALVEALGRAVFRAARVRFRA